MKVVGYRRVSTEDQANSGLGFEAQTHACEAWAARSGFTLACSFSEDVSGAAPIDKRLSLLEAISALEAGGVLIVAKRDRLGRDPILVAMIESAVARKGCRIVSAAGEGTDNDDPSSVLMRRLIDAFAEYERLIIKARTKAALAAKQRRNERVGSIPFGKSLAEDGKTLVPNQTERDAINLIRSLAAKPHRVIAAELDRAGFKTKGGRPWCHTTVAKILKRVG